MSIEHISKYLVRIDWQLKKGVGCNLGIVEDALPPIANELEEFDFFWGNYACAPYIEFECDTRAQAEMAEQEIVEAIRPLVVFEDIKPRDHHSYS